MYIYIIMLFSMKQAITNSMKVAIHITDVTVIVETKTYVAIYKMVEKGFSQN